MKNAVYITGTGTDVGKTYISALIVKCLVQKYPLKKTGYFKPVLSGAVKEGNKLIPEDALYVYKISKLAGDPFKAVSYTFEMSASPHLAAKKEGIEIKMEVIKNEWDHVSKKNDFVVIEGCGGIVCPIYWDKKHIMQTDLIKQFGAEIIIVTNASLGTINETLLTIHYAKSLDIPIKGLIVNNYDDYNIIHKDNINMIQEISGCKILAKVKNNQENIIFDQYLFN